MRRGNSEKILCIKLGIYSLTKDFPYVASKNYIRVLNEFCGRDAPMKSRKSIIVSAQPCIVLDVFFGIS